MFRHDRAVDVGSLEQTLKRGGEKEDAAQKEQKPNEERKEKVQGDGTAALIRAQRRVSISRMREERRGNYFKKLLIFEEMRAKSFSVSRIARHDSSRWRTSTRSSGSCNMSKR